MQDLDVLDKKILYELDLNARVSASKLAKKLRRSKQTVNFRLNRLIKEGIIKSFYTICNTSKLGWYYSKFYIKFKNITPNTEKELFKYLCKQKYVAYLSSVEGQYDCMILVMVKNASEMVKFQDKFMEEYGEFIQEKDLVTVLTTHRFNQRFLSGGEAKKNMRYPIDVKDYKVDTTDKKILNVLSTNARIPLVEIAKELNVDHKVVKYRIKKLEKEEIILGYAISLDYQKLGFTFFQINISLKQPLARREIINFFNGTEKCLFAIELLGKFDVLVEVHVKNNEELRNIIKEFRKKFVNKYNDYTILTLLKEYVMIWSPFSWC